MMLARALSLAGLRAEEGAPWGATPREAIQWAAALGARAVQLDAAAEGVRARELPRSGRRDVASLLRRLELAFAGLDLWIPPAHFTTPEHQDRAVEATLAAIELASELSDLVGSARAGLALALPPAAPASLRADLGRAAARHGVRLADFTPDTTGGHDGLDAGIDPAAVLAAGGDPTRAVFGATSLGGARWSSLGPAGRVAPGGEGSRLDELAYEVALATRGFDGFLVVDLRGLPDPASAARRGLRAG